MLFIHDNKCEQIQSGFINLSSFSGEVKTKLQNATTQDNVNEEGNDELIEGVDQQNNDVRIIIIFLCLLKVRIHLRIQHKVAF